MIPHTSAIEYFMGVARAPWIRLILQGGCPSPGLRHPSSLPEHLVIHIPGWAPKRFAITRERRLHRSNELASGRVRWLDQSFNLICTDVLIRLARPVVRCLPLPFLANSSQPVSTDASMAARPVPQQASKRLAVLPSNLGTFRFAPSAIHVCTRLPEP